MNDIKVPPFTKGQQELIKMTEKLANGRKICDVDDVDDDKDIKEMLSETIAKIENQKQTNFQRITKSPEALAEFIGSVLDICSNVFGECKHCPLNKTCIADKGFKQIALEWLKQESK